MSEELRPCPFCGGTKICTEKGINLNYCDNCSAESNIEHWNTRPIEDALNARIAELEAAQRWIPVSERLPEGSGHYIVFDDHGDIMSCEFLADYKGEPLWDDDDGVLYWMPLPEPPESE